MLGFGALGSFPLGSVPDEGGIAYLKTLTAGADAAAVVLRNAGKLRSAGARTAATALRAVGARRSAGADAGGSLLRSIGAVRAAGADVSGSVSWTVNLLLALVAGVDAAAAVTRAMTRTLTAAVSVGVVSIVADLFRGVTSTIRLHLPVDYFMEGLPQYREKGRTFEPSHGEAGEKTTVRASRRGRLSGSSGFTSRTDKRGYD